MSEPTERARKNVQCILQGLARAGQSRVAEVVGISETKVSRWKSEDAEMVAALLAACGLKVVPCEMQCYRLESITALMTLAKERMEQLQTPDQLVWDD